jgi:hypothetical protein
MRAILVAIVAAMALGGCSSACPELEEGSYLFSFDRRTGDCADDYETILFYEDGIDFDDPDCMTISEVEMGCETDLEFTCLSRNDGGTALGVNTFVMHMEPGSGGSFVGLMSVEYVDYFDASYDCEGTYDIAVTPL